MSRTIGEAVLARLQLLGELSDEDRAAVLALPGRIRSLQPGETVLVEGDCTPRRGRSPGPGR